mmetsp:Transcript_938/g.2002  ORF Transcript_938/g.2002 Transcript_938/m.2002 type:complete len:201 (+) Transcript_938:62-664(+)
MAFCSSRRWIPPGSEFRRNTASSRSWAWSKATSLAVNWPPRLRDSRLVSAMEMLLLVFPAAWGIVQENLATIPVRFSSCERVHSFSRSAGVTPTNRPRLGPTGRKLWGTTSARMVGFGFDFDFDFEFESDPASDDRNDAKPLPQEMVVAFLHNRISFIDHRRGSATSITRIGLSLFWFWLLLLRTERWPVQIRLCGTRSQ